MRLSFRMIEKNLRLVIYCFLLLILGNFQEIFYHENLTVCSAQTGSIELFVVAIHAVFTAPDSEIFEYFGFLYGVLRVQFDAFYSGTENLTES